jgi:hypothetical protein
MRQQNKAGARPAAALVCSQKIASFQQLFQVGPSPVQPLDQSGRELLATLRAAIVQYLTTTDSRHAGAEAVTACAYQFARLKCAFHVLSR